MSEIALKISLTKAEMGGAVQKYLTRNVRSNVQLNTEYDYHYHQYNLSCKYVVILKRIVMYDLDISIFSNINPKYLS